MEAPLGNIVRKILTNEVASKKLMQQIILGERFGGNADFNLDDRKIRVQRVASLDSNIDKKLKR